jgi:AcrR family transcriptional regulator
MARSPRLARAERETLILDTAAALFYARGVHEVGMDELVRATGLGKATVYRLFPSKAELVAAYLQRLSARIVTLIDGDIASHRDPADALRAILRAIAADVARDGFRGCPFNNASIEFDDRDHPAREAARDHRAVLLDRLTGLAEAIRPGHGATLGAQLALVIDGMYTNAAHLGAAGPAAAGPALVDALIGPRDQRAPARRNGGRSRHSS